MRILRFEVLVGLVFAVTFLPSAAWAPCGASATGETLLGPLTIPGARGPSLEGVGVLEFLNRDLACLECDSLTGWCPTEISRGARITARLRRGNTTRAFFALIPKHGCSGDHSKACTPTGYACDWDPSVACQPSEYVCDEDPLRACDPDAIPDPCVDGCGDGECVENPPVSPCVDTQHPEGECVASTSTCEDQDLGSCQVNLFNIETPEVTQEEIFAALREQVLKAFFEDECGSEGDQCPGAELVFKKIEEVEILDDGVTSQFVIGDVVVATTEPL
jgi:hypothetical protein